MKDFDYKIDNFLLPHINNIKEPIILELGVQKERAIKNFLRKLWKRIKN